jgi:hypothetical protein
MTMAEAILCCDSLINFLEGKSFTTEQEIMQMYRLKEKFEKEGHSKSNQATLTDFFKRGVASSSPSLSADSVTQNPDNKYLCPTCYLQINKDFTVNKIVHIFLLLHDAFLPFLSFSDLCAILELGYKKSGKIAYPELVRSRTFLTNELLLYSISLFS